MKQPQSIKTKQMRKPTHEELAFDEVIKVYDNTNCNYGEEGVAGYGIIVAPPPLVTK